MTNIIKPAIFFLAVVAGFIALYFHGQEIRKKHHLAIGKVLEVNVGGRGNWGPGINYVYVVNGRSISGSGSNHELMYSAHDLENHSFPVVYEETWFGYIDFLLITPRDFAYYGYAFPDSLRWVLKYMKK